MRRSVRAFRVAGANRDLRLVQLARLASELQKLVAQFA